MDRFIVAGPTKLLGRTRALGAKNAALKIMAAALLVDEPLTVSNVPRIRDVETMASVLRTLGMGVEFCGPDPDGAEKICIAPSGDLAHEAPYELVSRMRASIIVLGPLLARLGKAKVAMPGGCNIGNRKIDLHIRGLEALGASFEVHQGYLEASAPNGLVGGEVVLDIPSVGATENILMAAVLAQGTTAIENAAREPEIVDLADFLVRCGAKITGAGGTRIIVEGVKSLSGCDFRAVGDRIETGTLLIATAITGGEVFIEEARCDHLELVMAKLRDMGCEIEERPDGIGLAAPVRPRAVDLITLPYPGFPTDLQAPMMALLSLSDGVSIITENVFESRFTVVEELNRMGADIRNEGHHAVVRGVDALEGVPVRAPDLRGGAALLVAALAAQGSTEIQEIFHIDRGYQNIETRLNALGASIERVSSPIPTDIPAYEIINE